MSVTKFNMPLGLLKHKSTSLSYRMSAFKVVLKVIITALCFSSCVLLMIDVWEKYLRETTNTGIKIRYAAEQEIKFPCMTFCPVPGLKSAIFAYTKEQIHDASYSIEEIFSPDTANTFNNHDLFHIKSTFSHLSGVCYTICSFSNFKELNALNISLTTKFDVKVFIHENGTEMWLTGHHEFPFHISKETFDSSNNDDMSGAVVGLTVVEQTMKSRSERPCKSPHKEPDNDLELFNNCAKQTFEKIVSNSTEFKCKIVEIEYFLQESLATPPCQNEEIAKEMFQLFSSYLTNFIRNPSKYQCTLPCKQCMYLTTIDYYHKNIMGHHHEEKGFFRLAIQYTSLNVEERIENLEYDIGNLLVSAGGNLGLFLGFSCLSLLFSVLNVIYDFKSSATESNLKVSKWIKLSLASLLNVAVPA